MKTLVQCASVPAFLTEDSAREIDDLVKTLPADCGGYIRKAVAVDIQFEPGERAEVSIISTDAVDREREVILPEGIQMDQYRRNGVVLWNHDHDRPVAKCGWIKLFKGAIRAKTNYDLPEGIPDGNFKMFVEDVWAMTLAGVLKAKSVGLLPTTPKRGPTPEELQAHPDWQDVVIRDSTILLEYSLCATGVNQDCLIEAINTKSIKAGNLANFGIEIPKMPVKLPTREEIIASVLPFIKGPVAKKKATPKAKPIDINAMIEKALSEIDINQVVKKAQEIHKNRGRV